MLAGSTEPAASDGSVGEICPVRSKGQFIGKKMKGEGKLFIGCSGFTQCRYFRWALA
jgi:ssDNA-binding Zn-finger/Zn-ribbon topoisomerase 1